MGKSKIIKSTEISEELSKFLFRVFNDCIEIPNLIERSIIYHEIKRIVYVNSTHEKCSIIFSKSIHCVDFTFVYHSQFTY